jgi:hypothetical protein
LVIKSYCFGARVKRHNHPIIYQQLKSGTRKNKIKNQKAPHVQTEAKMRWERQERQERQRKWWRNLEDRLCARVVCESEVGESAVCERVVYERGVCTRVTCERMVCNKVGCDGAVCERVL